MKKLLCLSLCMMFINLPVVLNAQQNIFSKVYYDNVLNGIQSSGIVLAADGGYLISGSHAVEGMVMNIDSLGQLLWNKTFSLPYSFSRFNGICKTFDSSFLLFGDVFNNETQPVEALFIKVDESGDTIWSKVINNPDYHLYPVSVCQTTDSGFIVCGYSGENSEPYYSIYTARLDKNGNLIWSNILAAGNNTNVAYSVKQTPDGGYLLIGGYVDCTPCYSDAFLIKLTQAGAVSWSKKYDRSTSDFCFGYDFVNVSDGYICYLNSGLMKTDFDGNVIWTRSYELLDGSNCLNCPSPKLRLTSDSTLILLATEFIGMGSMVAKTNIDGTLLWVDDLFLSAADVIESEYEEIAILGNGPIFGVKGPGVNSPQIGLIQANRLGGSTECVHYLSINSLIDTISAAPVSFNSVTGGSSASVHPVINSIDLLEFDGCVDYVGGVKETTQQNGISIFPNPANSFVYIQAIDELKNAKLTVYNARMQIVLRETLNQKLTEIDISKLSSGLYFVKIETGNTSEYLKLVKE